MGEWFTYEIKFANKEENLAEAMAKKDLAVITQNLNTGGKSLSLNLKMINPEMFKTGYNPDDNLDNITIGINENDIYYVNKWVPDDRLTTAISKHFPNDVLEIKRKYSREYSYIAWYTKGGKDTTKNGTPVIDTIYQLNPKLCKDTGKFYKISLPIGDETDKWGSIILPKDNIINLGANTVVFFTTEKINISFKSGIIQMNTKELTEKYYKSITNFREDMQSTIEITGLPRRNFISKTDNQMGSHYYIVKIPCKEEISSNHYISIVASEWNVDLQSGSVRLGQKGKERNARISIDSLGMTPIRYSNQYIKQCYNETLRQPEIIEAEIERD